MFYELKKLNRISPIFQAVENCRGVDQREDYHPEGDVFNHLSQVTDIALRESNDIDLIIAAMVHDVGKQISTLGHAEYSCAMLKGFISEKTEWLVAQHIRIKLFLNGQMNNVKKAEYLFTHPWFTELVLLSRWDVMGRVPGAKIVFDRVKIIDTMLAMSNSGGCEP